MERSSVAGSCYTATGVARCASRLSTHRTACRDDTNANNHGSWYTETLPDFARCRRLQSGVSHQFLKLLVDEFVKSLSPTDSLREESRRPASRHQPSDQRLFQPPCRERDSHISVRTTRQVLLPGS